MSDEERQAAGPISHVQVQGVVGHAFAKPELLTRALTHSSAREPGVPVNERLEFLGDAVVALVVAEELFQRFPTWSEGDLTRVKGATVSAAALARASERLGLDEAVRVGRGLRATGSFPLSLRANVFEAIVGAIYLDGGLEPARDFVLRELRPEIAAVIGKKTAQNWKSFLQELTQRDLGLTPTYEIVDQTGPDHRKHFVAAALLGTQEVGRGEGASKKDSEQAAALAGLRAVLGEGFATADRQNLDQIPPIEVTRRLLHRPPPRAGGGASP
ncbi:MAG: ribonuclease III [Planctomycetota bacterium]|jgi:ribonuclease-3